MVVLVVAVVALVGIIIVAVTRQWFLATRAYNVVGVAGGGIGTVQ